MRPPNEIDFWRGFALVTIFINHVPGIVYAHFTSRNISISDSAELFVFLAGWSMRFIVGEGAHKPLRDVVFRLLGRVVEIYAAQVLITLLALAILAGAALYFNEPFFLDWHNAGPVFQNPAATHIGLVALTHQLGYFNILPLYVVVMAAAPAFALLDRISPWLAFAVSFVIWAATLVTGVNLPSWPVEGRWFFDPFAWQFIFVLGFLFARRNAGPGALARRHLKALRFVAAPIAIAGAAAAWFHWSPSPGQVPSPKLVFLFDKSHLSPARLIQFLAVVAVMGGVWKRLPGWFAPISEYMSKLGRNSLEVFCVGSVLSLCGQIARYFYGAGIAPDTVVLSVGIVIMGFAAWLKEWRERSRPASPSPA